MFDLILSYPPTYIVAILLCFGMGVEAGFRPGIAWRIPFLVTIATVFAWYLIEPVYAPREFQALNQEDVFNTFLSVILFLLAFRALVPALAGRYDRLAALPAAGLSPIVARQLLLGTAALWVVLITIGTWRMDWDLNAALFPNGRTEQGAMWARGAVASGSGDSFVAAAGYIYILVLAIFGILATFVRGVGLRLLCAVLIAISWPYAFLLGARNISLAVVTPGFLAFLLYGRSPLLVKVLLATALYIALDQVFRIMVVYRNVGFADVDEAQVQNVKHAGLNMATELTYIGGFLRSGVLQLQWGYGYVGDLSQVIPRFIWPDKPLIGIDYAIARGFASANAASGVNVTVSQGMIGGGVRQFGSAFGPLASAVLMAVWVRILTGLRVDNRVSRVCLYLLGLGLTFNLGRDITMLVLWPFVFAYVAVVAYEFSFGKRVPARA